MTGVAKAPVYLAKVNEKQRPDLVLRLRVLAKDNDVITDMRHLTP